ncbi:IS91 family transposase, partial [Shewanella sp. 10N.286.45.A1]
TVFAPLEKISQARATRPCPCCHKPMKFIQVHTRLTNFIMQQTRQPNPTV